MSVKRLRIEATAGVNIYFVVWRSSDNYVFDFSDNAFKATVGAATTPFLAATENTPTGGGGRSHYTANLNLSLLGTVDAFVQPYLRAGGSPAPLTDATLEDPLPISTQLGYASGSVISGKFTPVFKREMNSFEADFILLIDGVPTSFDGTGVLTIRDADGSLLFVALTSTTITDAVDGIKHLQFTRSAPGFTGDRYYSARLVLTDGSSTCTFQDTFRMLA